MWIKTVNFKSFTIIELLVVMVIVAILSNFGIRGYTASLRTERRKDAILSLGKAMLIIQSTESNTIAMCPDPNPSSSTISYLETSATSNTSCMSSSGFYYIHYNPSGYTPPEKIVSFMLNNELLILQANPVPRKSQINDLDCLVIYMSDQNKIYPDFCGVH